jgi:hypothetical protein
MVVKIEDDFYDSNDLPIMLILDDLDKKLISDMGNQKIYCRYPDGKDSKEIRKFMEGKH